jgi:hypothetical protein
MTEHPDCSDAGFVAVSDSELSWINESFLIYGRSLDSKIRTRIRSALRKLWMMSPAHAAAKKRCNVGPARYRCESCGRVCDSSKKIPLAQREAIEIDHIIPIGNTPGSNRSSASDSWDLFIARLFAPADLLRGYCHDCHLARTAAHNDIGLCLRPSDSASFDCLLPAVVSSSNKRKRVSYKLGAE